VKTTGRRVSPRVELELPTLGVDLTDEAEIADVFVSGDLSARTASVLAAALAIFADMGVVVDHEA
jgi:hypothetical protein